MKASIILVALCCQLLYCSVYAQAPAETAQSIETNSIAQIPAQLRVSYQLQEADSGDIHGQKIAPAGYGEVSRQIVLLDLSIRDGLATVVQTLKPNFWGTLRDNYISSLTWEFFGIHRNTQASNFLGKVLTAGGGFLLLLKIMFWVRRISRDKNKSLTDGRWVKLVNGLFVGWSILLLVPITIQVWTGSSSTEADISNAMKALTQNIELMQDFPHALSRIQGTQERLQQLLESCCSSLSSPETPSNLVQPMHGQSTIPGPQASTVQPSVEFFITNRMPFLELSNEIAELKFSLTTNLILSASSYPDQMLRSNLVLLRGDVARLPSPKSSSVPWASMLNILLFLIVLNAIVFARKIWAFVDSEF